MILCGGKGTRLGGLTRNFPKSMLEFGSRPFLDYLLITVTRLPFDKINLLAGYCGHSIRDRYHGLKLHGTEIAVSIDMEQKGTLSAFSELQYALSEWFWVCNGDTFISLKNIPRWEALISCNADPLRRIVTAEVADGSRYGSLTCQADGLVTDFREKSGSRDSCIVSTGFAKLMRVDIQAGLSSGEVSLESGVLMKLAVNGKLHAEQNMAADFIDFGIPEDYQKVAEVLKSRGELSDFDIF